MGLLTAHDWNCLNSRKNFQADYATHKSQWIAVARGVYQYRAGTQTPPVQPVDCEQDLRFALLGNVSFSTYLRRQRHLLFSAHSHFARAVARYMLDYEFAVISA
jgi:hypothetical protein